MSSKEGRKPNRLINEKSPYLLQHAHNPIDWFPWTDEAFEKARREDKPIFLSIGYSTCHWCHVMERESFEDAEVASLLNEKFIAIKVDREERPDIDHIYMTVCQAMTGQGGWPLTIVMTPERKPFFAGTYFPKRSKWGRPGLMEILARLAQVWEEDRAEIEKHADHVRDTLVPHMSRTAPGTIGKETLAKAVKQYAARFDPVYGGFGDAPKFPSPHNLLFLLRQWKVTQEPQTLAMVTKTLDSMYQGGIYDHVGFGFARYSVDREWLVPHFEKMLYDNALLAYTYLEGYEATGNALYARVAKEIFTYVLRDMTDREGGFYSAEDADSEGEEGKFYLWTPAEVLDVLGEERGNAYCRMYGITPSGNFEGRSIPNLIHARIPVHLPEEIEKSREQLFARREKRVHPGKDDKILTSWNGLMIAALAKGYRVLADERYRARAEQAVSFLWAKLRDANGRLLARYRDGEAAYLGYVDDYAFLTWGLLELYEATQDLDYLQKALSLTDDLLSLFWDDQDGGLFFYGSDAERLFARPKEIYDGATPSGNGVAACNFLRMYQLTGRPELLEKAERLLTAFAGTIAAYPPACSFSLMAVQLLTLPTRQIVIAGRADDPQAAAFLQAARTGYQPFSFLVLHDPEQALAALAPAAADKRMQNGRVTAYVCENFACQAPLTDLAEFQRALQEGRV